tara:strand:+ start:495 stop:920 length:426 start_codon:yes stop_codon:yes gene_type:complete
MKALFTFKVGFMMRVNLFLFLALVCSVSIAKSHHPQDFLKEISGDKNEGEKIVQHFCANCHAKDPLIAVGAPLQDDVAAWMPRIKQGLDLLLAHTQEGINAMPPMGGCFECSDEQIKMAVLALIPDELFEKIDVPSKKDHK